MPVVLAYTYDLFDSPISITKNILPQLTFWTESAYFKKHPFSKQNLG